ncbi:unnamed protein product [Orchesella dallaii]|uniref:Metalloendopeptidase n=1 Tax=Orchesella dallaii TaxID=48710 RepID=A0ABP1PUF1_9HEXA
MDRLRKVVCIPFYLFRANQKPYGDYVHIKDTGDCFSIVGRDGGAQHMSLASFCLDIGTIMHEMIHALGFYHEQSRQDRDKYVDILWKNIIENKKSNFHWYRGLQTYGVPYNTQSIMHYRSWEFSKNGKDTILDKNLEGERNTGVNREFYMWFLGIPIQSVPLADSTLGETLPFQQTTTESTTLLQNVSEQNVNENEGKGFPSGKNARHAALLDIDESDLTNEEKVAKEAHELRKLVNYSPEESANPLFKELEDKAYVQMLQERIHDVRARYAEAELEGEGEEDQDQGEDMDTQTALLEENAGGTANQEGPSVNEDVDTTKAEAKTPTEVENVEKCSNDENLNGNTESSKVENEGGQQGPSTMPGNESVVTPPGEDPESGQGETAVGIVETLTETTVAEKPTEMNIEKTSDVENEDVQEEATAVAQLHGAATHHRTIEENECEVLDGRTENTGDNEGFVNEDESSLKDSVITSVLEVEVVTDGFDCSGNRGPLRQMASESKYFVDVARLYNFKEAREICSKYNLVIAEVEGLGDHRTIEGFMSANEFYDAKGSSGGSSFFIGLNDLKTEGVFKHANGKNVTYQNFLPSQPDDKNEAEDCVTITKEKRDGAAGAADYDCNKTAHVFCMFRAETQCYNESKETMENRKLDAERGFHLLVNATERAYFVSNYQATWKEAMKQCDAKQMKVFNMDGVVTMGFFRSILKRERNFFRVRMPTVQYWTSGKFQKSHMNAPIIWHTKPELTESEERGVGKHNSTFSFSGLYHWSTAKKRDPGGPHGWRRDLCVSFGFDKNPEAIPYIRNTNCDLPAYFVCYVGYPDVSGEDEDEETTEETATEPINPEDMPVFPDPENETETAELEKELELDPRNFNVSCTTNDEEEDIAGRNGIRGNGFRWWSGFTVYIDSGYTSSERKLINTAMDRLRKVVCIPFYLFRRNQRPYGDYVYIQDKRQCYSRIGRQGGGQEMSLGRGCLRIGTIMHEMIHALGFWHEQARPDRDKYVNIFWKNIVQSERHNFYAQNNVDTFGVPYNTQSIMHYRSWEFSANGRDTILDKRGNKVGSLILQQTDIDKLRKMYRCG